MSEEVQNQSSNSDDSNTSECLEDIMWEEINDPWVARVEAQMQARMEAKFEASSSKQRRGYSQRYGNRDHEAAHAKLISDYFSSNPLYTDYQFCRRYRMRKHLFLRIVEALGSWSPYFQLCSDAFSKVGLSPLQKCTTAIRMLAYGTSADFMDETFGVAESTTLECMLKFVQGVRHIFSEEYLRKPTNEDIQLLLQVGEARGFSRMLGSLDCIHWQWGNYPVAWKGQFTRSHASPTIMLEVVASYDRWIWHAFFGVPGSNNDMNVLNWSPLFIYVLQGRAPEITFTVNGSEYKIRYYLVDEIYREWATFVKSVSVPLNEKDRLFAEKQEGARKDVECAFGILQTRWAIIRQAAHL